MTTLSHISYPVVLYAIGSKIFGYEITLNDIAWIMFFSNLPDFDFLYQLIVKRKGFDKSFQHHGWLSHWPIVYLPLLLAALITQNQLLILASASIYLHLFMDMFFVADGIMWFAPFSKKFYYYFCETTHGIHGQGWVKAYQRLPVYKVDILMVMIAGIIIIQSI